MKVALTLFIFCTILFLVILVTRLKKEKKASLSASVSFVSPPSSLAEVDAFSGDNPQDTQLDLALAYMELCQYEKAKQLLKTVIDSGNSEQVSEARKMFAMVLKQERSQ